MTLSIIVPVYNEEKTINKIIGKIEKNKIHGIDYEIIIIDDCSSDNTVNLIKQYENKYKIVYHKKNMGKGAAIRKGFEIAQGDIILVQDADLEYNPEEYPILLKPILDNRAKVVYGSRMLGAHTATHFYYYLGNKLVTLITNILFNSSLTDMETGYKVFRKEVVKNLNLKSNRFDIEPEITAKILKKYQIFEVPISYSARSFVDGKKITWKDGLIAVATLIKYRFVD